MYVMRMFCLEVPVISMEQQRKACSAGLQRQRNLKAFLDKGSWIADCERRSLSGVEMTGRGEVGVGCFFKWN